MKLSFMGNGRGRFALIGTFFVGSPKSITASDVNRDGKLDLIVSRPGPGRAAILLGNADGSFQPPIDFVPVFDPANAVGDFNHDAIPDLAVVEQVQNDVLTLLGDGTGHMVPAKRYPAGAGPVVVKAADFNNDGKDDLAIADFGSSRVSILLSSSD